MMSSLRKFTFAISSSDEFLVDTRGRVENKHSTKMLIFNTARAVFAARDRLSTQANITLRISIIFDVN